MTRTALLRGGSRGGETTVVPDDLGRIVAVSLAPGLVDVYDATTEFAHARGNETPATVYAFTEQQPLSGLDPSMIHMPQPPGT